MPLVTNIQAQAAFKAFVTGTSHTSPLRNWFQEPLLAKPILYGRDIRLIQPDFADTQAEADVFAASNPSIVVKEVLRQMTIVPGTNNNAFGLYDTAGDTSSDLLGNWVSPFDGSGFGYFPRFFRDAAGTDEISTSFGPTNWFFQAYAGILVWGGEDASDNWVSAGISEVYVTVFRYVGPTLENDSAGGGVGTEAFNVSFTQNMKVPSFGELFLKNGTVTTSSIPWIPTTDGILTGVSVATDLADTKNYTLEVLINHSVVSSITLTAGRVKAIQTVKVSFTPTDEISIRIVRSSGSGKSAFRNIRANLMLSIS
jgi:hypothetical protein